MKKLIPIILRNSILFLFLLPKIILGQANNISEFQYLNPLPNSRYVSVQSTIIIKKGPAINKASINSSLINVYGSKSGTHTGQMKLSSDSRTVIFIPDIPFATNEDIVINLSEGLMTQTGAKVGSLQFQFHTCNNINNFNISQSTAYSESIDSVSNEANTKSISSILATLPTFKVNKLDNPASGYLFLGLRPYLLIIDNDGIPVFYRNVNGYIFDFKVQPNGQLTYFLYQVGCYGLDSSYNIVRHYYTSNGYTLNVHELRIMPNGSYYIFGLRNVQMDMSKIVAGGQADAEIIDGALQEYDSTGNLIFQWDALDHYKITDVDDHVDLTQSTIDFDHFNAIEIDPDSNLMVSARNLDEVTKIDHNTGNIIWRLGGKNNQFTFINDTLGFSRQHDIRKLSNGDISLFDDGVYHPIQYSSFVEYKLDEVNKTATLINRYTHNEDVYTETEGSVQELSNGDKLISWGHVFSPAITEIHPDNSIAYELSYSAFQNKYRAFRFPWETNLFKTNTDSIDYGKTAYADSSLRFLTIYNPQDSVLKINQFYIKNSSYTVKDSLPLAIPARDSAKITIMFRPNQRGIFADKLNIRIIGNDQLIARQVILTGSTISLINPIEAPTNLTASSVSKDSILLIWRDNSNNETGFVIERKDGDSLSSGPFNVIDTVATNDTTYYDNTKKDSTYYTYRVFGINTDTLSDFSNTATVEVVTSVAKVPGIPKQFRLYQNYPNPFNPSTTINFDLPRGSFVTLKVYNILGEEVKTLINKFENAGRYSVLFNASNLSSGVYIYKLKTNNYSDIRKLVLLK